MKVSLGYNFLKGIFAKSAKEEKPLEKVSSLESVAQKIKGADIISEQNKALLLKNSKNYVEPLKTKFKSTKEMFEYAKQRCIDGIKQGYEHSVIMDTKRNLVLAEFKGTAEHCNIEGIKFLNLDKENTAVMHGHPENFPLSYADINTLRQYDINQIIAVDKNGEFSLAYKKPTKVTPKGLLGKYAEHKEKQKIYNAMVAYNEISGEDLLFYKNSLLPNDEAKENYKKIIHATLEEYTPKLNMKYFTNFGYIKNNKTN